MRGIPRARFFNTSRNMKVIILTGGIATGKSTVFRQLKQLGGRKLHFYDCDEVVAGLLSSGKLAENLISLFGGESVNEDDGSANKEFIRNIVFNDFEQKKKLELLLHPVLKQECLAEMEIARQNKQAHAFIADVPLYYEAGFSCGEDAVCVVGVSAKTQKKRLMERSCLNPALLEAMINSQMPTDYKMQQADYVLWNEGTQEVLRKQVEKFYYTII